MASNLVPTAVFVGQRDAPSSSPSAGSDARLPPLDRGDSDPDPEARYKEHSGCTTTASRTMTGTHGHGQVEYDQQDLENNHPIFRRNHDDGYGRRIYRNIDPNDLEIILSRSLPSAAGGLGLGLAPEPEPELIINNNILSYTARNRRRRSSASSSTTARTLGSNSVKSCPEESNQTHHIPNDDLEHGQHDRLPIIKTLSAPDESTPLLAAEAAPSSSSSSTYSVLSNPKSVPASAQSPYLGGVSPSRFRLLFLGLMTIHFVSWFDSTIMASSHPIITSYFDASNSASWLSTAFLLTSTSFQPFVGGLSDAIGRRTPYLLSAVIFILSTIWCALAQSMTSFIIARAVCGLGAGGTIALANIMVGDLVPIENRGTFQSYLNLVFGVGSMSGAALGGLMADYLGWRWEFGLQVPLLLAGLGVTFLTIPRDLGMDGEDNTDHMKGRGGAGFREAMRSFDYSGSALLSLGVTFLILGLSLGGNVLPWSDPYVISSLALFVIFLPLFLYAETKAVKPIMPLHLVRLSPHRNLLFSNAIAAMISSTVLFNVPLFFQGALLSSATTSGLRLLTCSLVSSTAGAATGLLITSTRRLKWPLVTGTTLIILGTLSLSCLQRSWPSFAYVLVLIPTHSGMGFQYTATSVSILAVSDRSLSPPDKSQVDDNHDPNQPPDQAHPKNQQNSSILPVGTTPREEEEPSKKRKSPKGVITSTLILVRSLGMVLGVSLSSLIVQNSLWYFLDINVQAAAEDKQFVIDEVRRSVEAIRDLDPLYQEQVVQSYESALRVCFGACVALAVLSWSVILPVRLPRLKRT